MDIAIYKTIPFEGIYGFRPKFGKKDEVFQYLKNMLTNPHFVSDSLSIIKYKLPKDNEISQRLISQSKFYECMLSIMGYELAAVLRNETPETSYFMLALQVHQELETLENYTSPKHIVELINQYNAIPAMVLSTIKNYSPEQTIPTKGMFVPIDTELLSERTVEELSNILKSLVNEYRKALNKFTGDRFSENKNTCLKIDNVIFDINPYYEVEDRIELNEHNLNVVYEYLELLTFDINMDSKGESMLSVDDVKQIHSFHFKAGQRPERKIIDCKMKKTHLSYFIRLLYLKLNQKKHCNVDAFRKILLDFNYYQSENDAKNLVDTFGREPDGFKSHPRYERLTTSVLKKLK